MSGVCWVVLAAMPSSHKPPVGVLTQTTGWCPKTRSAPRTQQARVTDPLMAQCWSSFSDAGTTLTHQWLNASCLLGTQLLVP